MYVTIDEVTALAQTVIKDSDDKDRNIWKAWCWQAMLNLGIGDDEIRVAELYPQDYVAPLPPDCRHILEVACYNSAGTQLSHKFRTGNRRIFADQRLSETATTGTNLDALVPVDVSNDRENIHLGTNGANVVTVVIRYFAYPIDENDQPLIREEDQMACVYFIRYMQAMRADDNRSRIAEAEIMWYREADRARARKKMASMTPDKARSIMSSLNRFIPNFKSIQSF